MLYTSVESFLSESTGLETEFIGTQSFKRLVDSRMAFHDINSVDEYLALLNKSTEELEELIENVVVHETWFFRDKEPFTYLKEFLGENWVSRYPGRKLRVISVPCSSGEEPYSIAISLLEAGLKPSQIHIDAVDISLKDIEKARIGHYGKSSFRGLENEYHKKYFTGSKNGYKLSPEVTGLVNFYCDNFINSGFFNDHEPYDIAFCRNLLIYLTKPARTKVLKQLDRLLVPGGLLFTGHAEPIFFQKNGYVPVDHPRSFASIKAESNPVHEPAINETVKEIAFPVLPPVKKIRHKIETKSIASDNITFPENSVMESMESTITDARRYADRGAFKKALELCKLCTRRTSTNPEVYYLTGLIYNAMNDFNLAEDYFHKALYLNPDHYDAVVHLSLIYEHKGDTKRTALMKKRAKRILSRESAMSVQSHE